VKLSALPVDVELELPRGGAAVIGFDFDADISGRELGIVIERVDTGAVALVPDPDRSDEDTGVVRFPFTEEQTEAITTAALRWSLVSASGAIVFAGPCTVLRGGRAAVGGSGVLRASLGEVMVRVVMDVTLGGGVGGGVELPIAQSDVTGLVGALAGRPTSTTIGSLEATAGTPPDAPPDDGQVHLWFNLGSEA
jgi:hypothetical protein